MARWVIVLAAISACQAAELDPQSEPPSAGAAGKGGSAATAGVGGVGGSMRTGGVGGVGGSANIPGVGGAGGSAGVGGAGGSAASGGVGGEGGSADTAAGAGEGGSVDTAGVGGRAAGASGGGASNAAAGGEAGGPPETWPAECVGLATQAAPESQLVGPAGVANFGDPALPGETMTADLNGHHRTYNRFDARNGMIGAYSYDGGIQITLPSLEVGTYHCSEATLSFINMSAGREGQVWYASNCCSCCTIQITSSGGPGQPITGTFQGRLTSSIQTWLDVENGEFTVVDRSGS